MSRDNCRNIEIKAKLADENEFNEKIKIAKNILGQNETEILKQHDVFFNVTEGRLKLRYEEGKTPKLVHYDRPNISGPKLSKFDILEVKDGELLEKMLNASIGTLGILDKTRHLFMYDRTRIHLDAVKNNNQTFFGMEFEVMLHPNENVETGNEVAEKLFKIFELKKEQLVEGSYFEILNA